MVCTRCFTFNHAPYIVDAMDGFTMQETTFPVVTVIVDDASTDGEQDVIRQYLSEHFEEPYRTEETEYAHIICANHKTNPNCHFVVVLLKYNHYSINKDKLPYLSKWLDNAKYHALCEGDDYWIDRCKLQLQYDVLEKNKDLVLTIHKTQLLNGENIKGVIPTQKIKKGILDQDRYFSKYNHIQFQLSSYFYRQSIYQDYCKKTNDFLRTPAVGDLKMLLFFLAVGKLFYMDRVMSTYRLRVLNGWTDTVLKDKNRMINHYQDLISLFNSYDKFTNYKYHEYCEYKQKKARYLIEKTKGNYRSLFTKNNLDCLRSERPLEVARLAYKAFLQLFGG